MKFFAVTLLAVLLSAAVAFPYHPMQHLARVPEMIPQAFNPVAHIHSWYTLIHAWVYTRYQTWSFGGHLTTTGLTWGIQCKGEGCSVKTGFVGYRDAAGTGFLSRRGIQAVGSTEHSHDYGKVYCPKGKFMTKVTCKDRACTSMELVCAPLKHGLRAVYGKRWGGVWSSDYQRVYCREGQYVDGIECVGSCTKHFNIFCTEVQAFS